MTKKKLTLFLLFFVNNYVFNQEIITDTLFVDFKTDTLINNTFFFDTIIDNRNLHSRVVSYSQTKKYILVPVDQEICLKKPLSTYLSGNLNKPLKDTLQLHIDYFIVEKYKGRFFNQYHLLADFPVFKVLNDSLKFMGTLVYKYEYQPVKKRSKKDQVVEELLPQWHRQFKIDMITANSYFNTNNNKPESLIDKKLTKPYYLNITTGGVIGYNFWQVEAELYLTRPETPGSRWFKSSIVRYQQTNNFETFAYGNKSEHYNKRIMANWQFDVSSNLLFGFVKWKNTEETKLYQLVQLSLSSNQSLVYNKINQPGLIYKIGLFESINYIIENSPEFQVGLYLAAGYKF